MRKRGTSGDHLGGDPRRCNNWALKVKKSLNPGVVTPGGCCSKEPDYLELEGFEQEN